MPKVIITKCDTCNIDDDVALTIPFCIPFCFGRITPFIAKLENVIKQLGSSVNTIKQLAKIDNSTKQIATSQNTTKQIGKGENE